MRFRFFAVLVAAIALAVLVPQAQAGALRYAGNQIAKGTSAAASVAAAGGASVAGTAESAGVATGGAFVNAAYATAHGAKTVGKAALKAPVMVGRGVASASKAIWKAAW